MREIIFRIDQRSTILNIDFEFVFLFCDCGLISICYWLFPIRCFLFFIFSRICPNLHMERTVTTVTNVHDHTTTTCEVVSTIAMCVQRARPPLHFDDDNRHSYTTTLETVVPRAGVLACVCTKVSPRFFL